MSDNVGIRLISLFTMDFHKTSALQWTVGPLGQRLSAFWLTLPCYSCWRNMWTAPKWYWSHNPICVHTAQSEHCLCFQLLEITRCCVPVTSLCAATHHPITPSHYIAIAFCYSLLLCFYCWLCFQKSVSNMLSVSYYFETADRRSSKSNLFVIVRGMVW